MRRTVLLLTVPMVLLAACGGDKMTKKETKKGWESTSKVLAQGESSMAGSVEVKTTEDGAEAAASVEQSCAEGGTATFDGTARAASSENGALAEFDVTVLFSGCTVDGRTMDGELSYLMAGETDRASANSEMRVVGELRYSGDVSGSCSIDMKAERGISANPGDLGITKTRSGTICGFEADKILGLFG